MSWFSDLAPSLEEYVLVLFLLALGSPLLLYPDQSQRSVLACLEDALGYCMKVTQGYKNNTYTGNMKQL